MTDRPTAAAPVIMVRGLRFRYPGTSEDVLRVPFLDVPPTGMTAIAGPSGAGKSTLIELLAGTLREPYEGSVQVLGLEWRSLARDADRQRQLRRIGLIPQDYALLTSRTPAELLMQDLADSGVPREERDARTEAALGTVGLGPFAGRAIAGLSGGQRQRVAIARMLARRVECVIADEPTANLDPALTAEAMRLFRQLAAHVPVVIITHDPAVADACDRTIVLQSAVTTPGSVLAAAPRRRLRRALAGVAAVAVIFAAGVYTAHTLLTRPASPGHLVALSHSHTPSPSSSPLPSVSPSPSDSPTHHRRHHHRAHCYDSCGQAEPVIFTAGNYSGTEPSQIDISGDGGNIVTGLTWQSWPSCTTQASCNGLTAVGQGTVGVDNCVPDCAEGTVRYEPVTITLSDPVAGTPTVWGELNENITSQPPESFSCLYPDECAAGAQ